MNDDVNCQQCPLLRAVAFKIKGGDFVLATPVVIPWVERRTQAFVVRLHWTYRKLFR